MPVFNKGACGRIGKQVRRMEAIPDSNVGGRSATYAGHCELPVTFRNDSGEIIAKYALMAITDAAPDGQGCWVLTADKPSATFCRLYAVNGPYPVEIGGKGQCYTSGHVLVKYDTGTPVNGEGFGAKSGQFTASKNYPCCLDVFGIWDSENKIMQAYLHPVTGFPAMLKTSLTPGGTADAYPCKPDGTIIDSGWYWTIKDTIGNKRARGKDDTGTTGAMCLVEVLADGTKAIVEIQQQAERIKATAKELIDGSTGTVDNVTVRCNGQSPVDAAADGLSVNNPLNYYVPDDGVCFLESNGASWDITGVPLVAVSPLTGWQYNDSSEDVEDKTRAARVNVAGDESAWTKIDDTTQC